MVFVQAFGTGVRKRREICSREKCASMLLHTACPTRWKRHTDAATCSTSEYFLCRHGLIFAWHNAYIFHWIIGSARSSPPLYLFLNFTIELPRFAGSQRHLSGKFPFLLASKILLRDSQPMERIRCLTSRCYKVSYCCNDMQNRMCYERSGGKIWSSHPVNPIKRFDHEYASQPSPVRRFESSGHVHRREVIRKNRTTLFLHLSLLYAVRFDCTRPDPSSTHHLATSSGKGCARLGRTHQR
jgi:hypothetical protein